MRESLSEIATNYFDTLAKQFPVMCASDEFHFLPRSQAAAHYFDRIDDLSENSIANCISNLKDFAEKFEHFESCRLDSEEHIDLQLLKANVAGILIEFEETRTWQHNPLLYLKIAFIGLDHALNKPAREEEEVLDRALARLYSIPQLLERAAANIDRIPRSYFSAALSMIANCRDYLVQLSKDYAPTNSNSWKNGLEKVHTALGSFEAFVTGRNPVSESDLPTADVETILTKQYASRRSVPEAFQIAVEEWAATIEQLKQLQSEIDPGKSWLELYHEHRPANVERFNTLTLYQQEIENLQQFFRLNGFAVIEAQGFPEVRETPLYLRAVRSSASFSADFSRDVREKDYFYITTSRTARKTNETDRLLHERLHREYKFLTAHETFPGHYLLDSVRRNLPNPVRSQIESALFYEGWAYYVESLLTEYGYAKDPVEKLVDCKRTLWRAARCQIDLGLSMGTLTMDDAVELLRTAGFSAEEAVGQIYRFRLNPGYQLCYSLGRYELRELRRKYQTKLGRDRFHEELLLGGQAPFHLIGERFDVLDLDNQEAERIMN